MSSMCRARVRRISKILADSGLTIARVFTQIGTIVKLIMNDASHSWIDFLVAFQHFELFVCLSVAFVELVNVCFITFLEWSFIIVLIFYVLLHKLQGFLI